MARRDTAARRYAEAAFEVALRDGTVDAWEVLPFAGDRFSCQRLTAALNPNNQNPLRCT